MDIDSEQSLIMARRLKQLREEKGLSHEKLSRALHDQYNVRISPDSLINYEVADEFHSKAYKNQGMRVEYLRCLSDFYRVSADYILGRTADPSRTPCAMDELGLSERSLEWLKSLKQGSSVRDNMAADMCAIIEDSNFQLLMYNLREYGKAITAEAIYDKVWEYYFPEDCVMYQGVALQKHERFKATIDEIAHSNKCDGYVSKYLELVSFLNTDGTEGAGVTKFADLLVGVEGFTPSELCVHRVNKYLTLLMESIRFDVSNSEITHFFEQ